MGGVRGRGENNLIFERVELKLKLKSLSISCSLIRDYVVYESCVGGVGKRHGKRERERRQRKRRQIE